MQSRENGQKPQFWLFLTISKSNISKLQIFMKIKVLSHFSTNFSSKTKKVVSANFEKNIKVSDFGLIWRRFSEYHQIKKFFSKIRLSLSYHYSPLTTCKKSEKS